MRTAPLLLTALSTQFAHAQPPTQWLRTAGGFSQFVPYHSAAAATGHIYTAGMGAAMDFGNGITVPGEGHVIARYDSSGTISWARALTTTAGESGNIRAIATNSEGELWVAGDFMSSTLTLDTIVLANASFAAAFLARLDSTGAVQFAVSWAGPSASNTWAAGICTNSADQVYVTGTSDAETFTVGGITLVNPAGGNQLFAVMFDAEGSALWTTMSTAPLGDAAGYCVSADAAGNAYVLGHSTGLFILDGDSIDTGNITQIVLIKITVGGVVERMDLIAKCVPLDIAVDDAGNAYVCGYIQSTAIFGNDTLVPSVMDGFVVAYDSNGDHRWVVGVQGEMDNELCWSVDLDAAKTGLVVGGTFVLSASFGGVVVETGLSPSDGFIMRLDTAGTVQWVKDMTGDGPTLFAEACLDPWDHLYASGITQSAMSYLGEPVQNGSGNNAFLARFGDLSTSVPHAAGAGELQVYPNPCDGAFTVALPADARTVIISDAQGREQERRSVRGASSASFQVDVPGVYAVSVLTETGRAVARMAVR